MQLAFPLAGAVVNEIVKTVGKKLAAVGAKKLASTAAGKAAAGLAGLTEAQIAGIASGKLNALNILRAAAVKRAAPKVAKSLGMTTKQLNALIKELKIKESYKAVAKGRAYYSNAKKLLTNPAEYVRNKGRNAIITEVQHQTNDVVNDLFQDEVSDNDSINESLTKKSRNQFLLDLIQEKLSSFSPQLQLPRYFFESPESYETEFLERVSEMLDDDLPYDVEGYDYGYVMYVGEKGGTNEKGGGGYTRLFEPDEYIQYISNLIEEGYYSEPTGDFL